MRGLCDTNRCRQHCGLWCWGLPLSGTVSCFHYWADGVWRPIPTFQTFHAAPWNSHHCHVLSTVIVTGHRQLAIWIKPWWTGWQDGRHSSALTFCFACCSQPTRKPHLQSSVIFTYHQYISIHTGRKGGGVIGTAQEAVCVECVNNEPYMPDLVVSVFSLRVRILENVRQFFPCLHFFFFFLRLEISLHILIPLFMAGLVHSGSMSWDNCDWVFRDQLRVSSFPDRVPTLCLDSCIASPLCCSLQTELSQLP